MKDLEKGMRNLVEAYQSSSMTQEEFSSKHGISKGKLHYWIKKLSIPVRERPVPDFIPLDVAPLPVLKSILIRTADGMEIQIPV